MRVAASRCVRVSFVSGAFLLLVWGGCSSSAPFDRVEASQAALRNTEQALQGLSNAAGFLEDSAVLPKAFGSGSDHLQFKGGLDKGIDQLGKFLKERVFVEGNLESEGNASATYFMKPAVVCDPRDSGCTDFFTKNQIRLLVTSPAEGDVDVALLYSDNRFNPLTFHLYRNSLGLAVDLAASAETVRGISGDQGSVPYQLAGAVLFELVKNAEIDYSFRVSVVEDIAVSVTKDDQAFAFGLAATMPTWEARANGKSKTLTLTENVGRLSGKLPLSSFVDSAFNLGLDDPAPANDPIDLLLAGLTGSVTLDGAQDHLRLGNLGLGGVTSYVKHGQDVLFGVDLNAQNGRTFDVDVSLASDSSTVVQVSPVFDLSLRLAFSSIANSVQGLPSYLLDDTLRIKLSGDAHPTIKGLGGAGDGVQVVTGQLQLMSAAAPATDVTVAAGQCLVSRAAAGGDEHAWSGFQAGECP